ncbi:300_t:CDS:1, partial [Racocetra persica]
QEINFLHRYDFANDFANELSEYELSELNTVFAQEQTLLNVNESNLQFLNNSFHNENGITTSFSINQTIANTPFIQTNGYDMMHHNIDEIGTNIINDNANYEFFGFYCNDTTSYSYA